MRTIKIYNKSFTPLTTLTDVDFNALSYKRVFMEIGECEFTVKLSSDKVTEANLEMYNRVEILDDGVVKFIGVILRKTVGIDVAIIRCRELTYVLKKRILDANYSASGVAGTLITDLVTTINALDDTGIIVGDVASAYGSVNITINRGNAFDTLKDIVKTTGNQFRLEADRSIKATLDVGEDLTDSVIFQYNTALVASANILKFQIDEDGDQVVSKAYGKSDANTTTRNDAGLQTKYGVLETYKDFRVANTLTVLEEFTDVELKDKIFSPDIELSPKVGDTFDVGDTIRLILRNSLIDLDESYQVLEKRVQYQGAQVNISVKINDLPTGLADKMSERDRRIDLLEKEL